MPAPGEPFTRRRFMNKLIAAIVASAFAFGTVSTFAADAAKKDELTTEQRTEMRERAAKMKEQGTQAPAQDKMQKKADKDKRSAVQPRKHSQKVAKRSTKKTQRRA
jgi:hypothetical protein